LTLQEKLDDARAKYHQLVTGQRAKVFVDQNGERIEYDSVSKIALAQYIRDLERQLGTASPGPIVFWL
jgi:hypothetical protein